MIFFLIAAVDKNLGIGKNGRLPWHFKTDLKYFHDTTIGNGRNVIIMGRGTWESIPSSQRPLAKRKNIVITRNTSYAIPQTVKKTSSLAEAFAEAERFQPEQVFVIGGSRIFQEAIKHHQCAGLYLTEIEAVFDCDVFFPQIDLSKFKMIKQSQIHEENGIKFRFMKYQVT